MKRRLPLLVMCVFLGFVALATARTWKSSEGRFSIDAEAVGLKDGRVQLKKPDGSVIAVPLASLSEEDRQYVRSRFPAAGEPGNSADDTKYREWTTSNGKFRTPATFLGVSGNRVRLRKPDGTEISVEKKLLSEDDQRWIDEELRRRADKNAGDAAADDPKSHRSEQTEEEHGKQDPSSDEASQSDKEIGSQQIEMKLVDLSLPKATGRGKVVKLSDYILHMCRPRSVYMLLKDENIAAAFHRVVQKEPTYNAAAPLRGTIAFGSRQYGFALDAKKSNTAGYDLLYFDSDGDGDLTKSKPISAVGATQSSPKMPQSQFPRVTVNVKLDGESYEYAFSMNALCNRSGSNEYVVVSVLPAAYREGILVQKSKRTKVLLVDRNCNGRFDDAVAWNPGGGISEGDVLLFNPAPKASSGSGLLDRDQNFVGKLVSLCNHFYRLEVRPSGSSLKLSPIQCSLGAVTHPKFAYCAMLLNEEYGAIVASGAKNQKVLLPEGTWKVCSYTISDGVDAGKRPTSATAAFESHDSPAVTVCKGKPAVLPFGETFHAVVTAARAGDKGVSLSLAIVGAGGERCTNLLIKGSRGPKPHFVIKDQSDKVVKEGDFEYG